MPKLNGLVMASESAENQKRRGKLGWDEVGMGTATGIVSELSAVRRN